MEDFEAARERLWDAIHKLQRKKTLNAIREARQLLRDWMGQHPGDYYTQDAGESLAMMEDALEYIEAEKATEPVAA
jgi:hypothetical protein